MSADQPSSPVPEVHRGSCGFCRHIERLPAGSHGYAHCQAPQLRGIRVFWTECREDKTKCGSQSAWWEGR